MSLKSKFYYFKNIFKTVYANFAILSIKKSLYIYINNKSLKEQQGQKW